MIKVFAPMLGAFKGDGKLADGTELRGHLEGSEALENIAYAFRARMEGEDSRRLIDAFFVLAEAPGGRMEMQFYETRENVHRLSWAPGAEQNADMASHTFRFEGKRDNGTDVRISFTLTSAEKCDVRFESLSRRGEWREHWNMALKRAQQERVGAVDRRAA